MKQSMGVAARVFVLPLVDTNPMRRLILPLALVGLLSFFVTATSTAEAQRDTSSSGESRSSFSSDPDDPSNLLRHEIPERRKQRESLLPVSPAKPIHDATGKFKEYMLREFHLDLGLSINHLFQGITEALPDQDKLGTATDLDFIASLGLVLRGKPTQGEILFHLEGRWDYGTRGPQDLGFISLASAGGTANAFSEYTPAFIVRNLYWVQGCPEAGWGYRIGKITPDSILATSRHITPLTTFLSNAGTGFFCNAYPDSGLGAVGAWRPSDRFRILGLVSDANADRTDFGDIAEGDFYKALELGVKIAPRTEKAGHSKLTVWHNDGTKDGQPMNGSTGLDGWGLTVKVEQELTKDGQIVGILRWGRSWDNSAVFKQQAGAHFLFYDPIGAAKRDVAGIAGNWIDSVVPGARDEYNVEAFYRFPLFPSLDVRLNYQLVINPALTQEFDLASVFSLGFRTVF